MARQCKSIEEKHRFVLTLPLYCEKWQRDRMDTIFKVANAMKNNLIAFEKRQLHNFVRRKDYRELQKALAAAYKAKDEERIAKLCEQWSSLISGAEFTAYAFEKRINKYRLHYRSKGKTSCVVPSHVAQKLAASVWDMFEDFFYGSGKTVSFSKWTEFTTISGKNAGAGIIYHKGDSYIRINGMKLQILWNKHDRYGYETEAMKRELRFCNITRRWYANGWKYFVQFVLVGVPPTKITPETGEELHPLGKGRVGHDIGTQTLASVGDKNVQLVELASDIQKIEGQFRRINRAMDRSRKATNPQMFDARGRVIPKDKLPQECLTCYGARRWNKSKRYLRLESERRALYRQQADMRLQKHRELANQLLAFGDEHYIEEMRFRALAKKAKEAKKNKDGKNISRKRFGKSIANKAPAMMVNILTSKVEQAGGTFQKVDTFKMKASQYNHLTQTYTKKALSKRWNVMPDGKRIQRDLYSAFLIKNVNKSLTKPDNRRCKPGYPAFVKLHDKEIERLSSMFTPISMGIRHAS